MITRPERYSPSANLNSLETNPCDSESDAPEGYDVTSGEPKNVTCNDLMPCLLKITFMELTAFFYF